MADKQLFSQEALDKLRTPERLDKMLPITTPVNWVAAAAIGVLLLAVLLWSIFGAFTEKTEGMGLIMDSAGVINVSHIAGGKVSGIYISTGSYVHKGDRIVTLEQANETANTNMARYSVDLADNGRDTVRYAYEYDMKQYQQGVNMDVYSDYEGIVDEVMVEKGMYLTSGMPICSVRITQNRDELSGILYIPVEKGKRVEPGMTIQLAPNGVDVSETGSLIGVVRSVSQYPISGQGVKMGLGNVELAQWIFEQKGRALIEVRFDLVRDESSESGYLWTSSVGDHSPITPGSFCRGNIIIERMPPIEKVFYKISQWVRSR
ncbi:hypothetical protein [Selenomonas sp. AB3002]|jgi:hypothetical protein|uniref:hypothetical protein n=1 Tax=Selenomonas sp. AB3002 TaxID=1392502 RepID=UPI0004951F35